MELITDRTQSDVDRAKYLAQRIKNGTATEAEHAEYLTDLKGTYKSSDMNRVETCMSALVYRLRALDFPVSGYKSIRLWGRSSTPTPEQLEQYRSNVAAVRQGIDKVLQYYNAESPYPLPEAPDDMVKLTYQEANDIEQILQSIENQLDDMDSQFYWYYSGEVYAGEI